MSEDDRPNDHDRPDALTHDPICLTCGHTVHRLPCDRCDCTPGGDARCR